MPKSRSSTIAVLPTWGGPVLVGADAPPAGPAHCRAISCAPRVLAPILRRAAKLNRQARKDNAMKTFARFLKKRLLAGVALLVLLSNGQAMAAANDLLVGDYNTGNILRYDANTGAFLGIFASSSQLAGPVTLAFGPDGNLYVAGEVSGNVTRFAGQTGAFIDTFIPHGTGGLVSAHGLTFGPNQNLYVTGGSANVLRFNGLTGAFIDTFVASGSGGLRGPLGLLFGPGGNFYVAGGDTDSVLLFNGVTGAFINVFASGGGLLLAAGEIFGPDGNLYVTSSFTNQVLRYNGTTGAFIDVFASGGGLSFPNQLAFGPDGNLYVTGEDSGVMRYNGTTGAFIDNFVPRGTGGLQHPVGLIFTTVVHNVFSAEVSLAFGAVANDDTFEAKGTFTLGDGSDGIDPLTEDVSLQVGAFSTTIPAGSFIQDRKGKFTFEGVINHVALQVVIGSLSGGKFKFEGSGAGADLRGTLVPLTVRLTIGDDTGNTSLTNGTATFKKMQP